MFVWPRWTNYNPPPCLNNPNERFRSLYWKSQEATEGIIDAMASCDDESRFWMLLGLESLSTVDPIALGAIQALVYDTDIFIRSEASKWLEGQ